MPGDDPQHSLPVSDNSDYRTGPYCRWPFGITISVGSAVSPCAARFDAWHHRANQYSLGSVGFRAWVLQVTISWSVPR